MSEEEQLVGTLIKIESHRQVEFIPNEYSRHVIDSEGLPVYAEPQPQLTIPKSIADEFDQIYEDTEEYQTNVAQMFSSMQHYFVLESYPEILHWLEDDVKNTNVVLAYLAGKALGVDLVKVVEG